MVFATSILISILSMTFMVASGYRSCSCDIVQCMSTSVAKAITLNIYMCMYIHFCRLFPRTVYICHENFSGMMCIKTKCSVIMLVGKYASSYMYMPYCATLPTAV